MSSFWHKKVVYKLLLLFCYIRLPFQNAFTFTLSISSELAILKFRSWDRKRNIWINKGLFDEAVTCYWICQLLSCNAARVFLYSSTTVKPNVCVFVFIFIRAFGCVCAHMENGSVVRSITGIFHLCFCVTVSIGRYSPEYCKCEV